MEITILVDGVNVGSGTIVLIDRSEPHTSTRIDRVQVTGTALADNTVVGSVVGEYQDYVAYEQGGTREVAIPLNIYIDSTLLATADITYVDNYSPVIPQQKRRFPWWILLLGIPIVIVLMKKEEKK